MTSASKKIVITGATGLIGSALYATLRSTGYDIVVLSRNPENAQRMFPDAQQHLRWSPGLDGEWKQAIDGAYAVVHLAGATIFGRMTEQHKRLVYDSRIDGTRSIVDAIQACKRPPELLLLNSAVGFYGETGETPTDESAPPGTDFLAEVCKAWEVEAMKAQSTTTRVAICRTGIVLATEGGALTTMLPVFKLGLGGWLGNGRQWFPWVHIADVTGLMMYLLDSADEQGVYNAVAPGIVRNKKYSKMLGTVLQRPVLFPVPGFLLHLAFKEFARSILDHKYVLPRRTLERGYVFSFPELNDALKDLL